MQGNDICSYFGQCGGCRHQNLTESAYVEKKTSFIQRSFADKGLIRKLDRFIRLPMGLRRRACFAFYKGVFGFNESQSHKIVPLKTCPQLTPNLSGLMPALSTLVKTIGGTGDIFVLDTYAGVDVHIKKGGASLTLELAETLSQFAAQNNIARLMFNCIPVLERVSRPFPPETFLQPSMEGEHILQELVLNETQNVQTAIDLFCGVGTFTKPLLDKGIQTIGYDCLPAVKEILKENGVVRDLFRHPLSTRELNGTHLVILDPPRAGALEQIRPLREALVSKIVMISCNPVTAARDTALLTAAGWQIQKFIAIDQFTYSDHIEVFLSFIPKAE